MKSWLLLSCLGLLAAGAQAQVANAGFESGSPGQTPPGWFVPPAVLEAGYSAQISTDGPREGKQYAIVSLSGRPGNGFGNLMQSIDATPFRGKKVRFRAAVRYEAGNGFGRAQLWMRIDRRGGGRGFFDNMGDRPITSSNWAFYDVSGVIDSDAESINFGMMLVGVGRASIDAVSLGEGSGTDPTAAPAKSLTALGLDNLIAYTKLLGYVRHFHPSDAVEKADWHAVAIAGVPVAEGAKDPADLAQKLETFFKPIAPTVRVYPTGRKPATAPGLTAPSSASNLQIVTWENTGFGGGNIPANQNIYRSRRAFASAPGGVVPSGVPDPRTPFEADLGGGVSCLVPLALFADNGSALPRTADPKSLELPAAVASGDDRTTRLADVALAWNVFEQFYPYFDVVKTDWPGVLRQSLSSAATDGNARAFLNTLRRLVASAMDGHGYVGHPSDDAVANPPIAVDWVEGKLVVTQTAPGTTKPRVGDEILQVDGRRVDELWKSLEPTVSGATEQWRRARARSMMLAGPQGSEATLRVVSGTSEPYQVILKRTGPPAAESRPKPIEEIRPGIWYVDLDAPRADMEAYKKAIPDLAKAKGIVFDMRGYPNEVAMDVLRRLSNQPITSAFWNVPKVSKPDRAQMAFVESRWSPAPPLEPRFTGKIAFVTDGRAISYAESVMGIVEHYKLGEIVGGPTAGTNGNVNPFSLPGGYTVVFTGMKVVKHDGSTHHGVGVRPTVPVGRTIAGVAAKRDELLERAIQIVGG